MAKLLRMNDINLKIILLFLFWKILIILVLFFSINYIPLAFKDRFLGGGPINFQLFPSLFSWANFDGEHYLSISIFGYKNLEQAFFPVYPFLISIFAKPFTLNGISNLISHTIVGLIISNISFLLALIYLFKLLIIDYSKKIAFITLFLIVTFPTSFFFGALYNESLFLLLIILSFLYARKEKWYLAIFFGIVASATRTFGILLFPALLFEAYQQKMKPSKIIWIFLVPLGLILYMVYQYFTVGDPLAFYHLQTIVGNQHQQGIILLPQIYFRYIKILLTINGFEPIYQTVILEFLVGIVFFLLPLYGYYKKVRVSYILYALTGFLLPTIQGSFSSLPRYVLILFPTFLILALGINQINKFLKLVLLFIFTSLLILESALFFRVYWVA